jgi:hypothetical protein
VLHCRRHVHVTIEEHSVDLQRVIITKFTFVLENCIEP